MNDLEYVVKRLKTSNKSAVAEAVGLSSRTVRDIASGKVKQPQFETVRRLAEHFRAPVSA